MATMLSRWGAILIVVLAINTGGCGKSGRPVLVPAIGEVMFKGEPLTAGSIIFFPDKSVDYQNDRPSSLLQVNGSFIMKTYPFGDGVSPGKYKVCLNPPLANAIKLPQYGDPKKTPWEIEIPETGDKNIILEAQ
ncbi:hypothetical protein [Schlesneria paludicola]|uniref:hypothetical protein n=1 Tax=Schlesneria paludicola TaxID=360056 RepID=UPI00029A72AA|nr:hypothetical protein [Schlesneria paludicola]